MSEKKKVNDLLKEFPDLFPKYSPLYVRIKFPFTIDCEDGWYDLLRDLCLSIREELKKDPDLKNKFTVDQVKQKFGGLRFYASCANKRISDLIDEAEEKSYTICEKCGSPGKLRSDLPWIQTLCDKCYKEKLEEIRRWRR